MSKLLQKNSKGPVVFLLTALLAVYPIATQAADVVKPAVPASTINGQSGSGVGEQKVSLEDAINIVRGHIDIPAAYDNFSSGYSTDLERQIWSLSWNASKGSGGSVNAQVDSATGELVSLNMWRSGSDGFKMPEVTEAEARTLVEKFIKEVLPEKSASLRLVPPESTLLPINIYGSLTYQFSFERLVNGAPVLGDGVKIQLSSEDGAVMNYNLTWSKGEFADPQKAITPDKAKQAFGEAGLLELQYYQAPIYWIMKSEEKREVLLVYKLKQQETMGAIDALTGKPLEQAPGQWINAANGSSSQMSKDAAVPAAALSPEEQKEVDETAKLITKDEAVARVKQVLDLPENLNLQYSNLYYNSSTGARIWNLEWSGNVDGDKDSYRSISARVGAEKGDLIGFSTYSNGDNSGKEAKIGLEAGQKIAEDFIKSVQPERFAQTKLNAKALESLRQSLNAAAASDPVKGVITLPVPGNGYNFSYQRYVNDIVFPNNTISVTVDPYTGNVTSFDVTWADLDFPAASNLLTGQQAADSFLAARPMTLTYVKIYKDNGQYEMRMVYLPKVSDSNSNAGDMIDAKTGKLLSYNGKPVTELPRPIEFKDIDGLAEAKEIALFGRAGIFGEYGTEFRPQEEITLKSFIKAMDQVYNGGYGEQPDDEELLEIAKNNGWLKEDLTVDAKVNRELAAKIIVRMLGYERVAQLEGIFQIPYQDAAAVSEDAKGYVALAWAFGIQKIDGEKFDPKHALTRAEGAALLYDSLSFKR